MELEPGKTYRLRVLEIGEVIQPNENMHSVMRWPLYLKDRVYGAEVLYVPHYIVTKLKNIELWTGDKINEFDIFISKEVHGDAEHYQVERVQDERNYMSNDERNDKIRELIYDLQREKNFDKLYEMIGNFYLSTEVPLEDLKEHLDDRGYKLMNKIIKMGNNLIFKIP